MNIQNLLQIFHCSKYQSTGGTHTYFDNKIDLTFRNTAGTQDVDFNIPGTVVEHSNNKADDLF